MMALLVGGTNRGRLALAQAVTPAAELRRFEKTEVHMGSPFTIIFYCADEKVANAAFSAAFNRISKLDKILSDYDLESETSRICASAPQEAPVAVSKDLAHVLARSADISAQSKGAFDPSIGALTRLWRQARRQKQIPDPKKLKEALNLSGMGHIKLDAAKATVQIDAAGVRLDFGGIGQGYAADEVIRILTELGIKHCLVNASGDVIAREPPPGEQGWKVALTGLQPRGEAPTHFVWLKNAAMTTSGDAFQFVEIDGKRYSHLVDPKTGLGISRRISATVFAPTCMLADAWATVLCILPRDQGVETLQNAVPGAEALILEQQDGETLEKVTAGFPRRNAIQKSAR